MQGGTPSAKFDTPGTTIAGTITEPPTIQQQRNFDTQALEYWEDGNPKYMLVVNIDTGKVDPNVDNDDGVRAIYVRANLQKAVREAVRLAGQEGLEVGGHLAVTYTGDGTPPRRGANAPKLYSAVYKAAQATAAQNFLNTTPQQNAQTSAQQPAQQAAQYVADTPATPAPAGLDPKALEALKALGIDLNSLGGGQ
jgi:hypothetical protein